MSAVRYDQRVHNIEKELKALRRTTKSQKEDLRNLWNLKKDSENLKNFITAIRELDQKLENLIGEIEEKDLRSVKESLENLESRREQVPFEKLREVKKQDIDKSEEKIIDKILSEEEKIRKGDKEISSVIPKVIEDKKEKIRKSPTIVFKRSN